MTKLMAITACPCSFTDRELKETQDFCQENHICQEICKINEFDIPDSVRIRRTVAIICKKPSLLYFGKSQARHMNMIEGSNMDDLGDYRPGKRAIQELGVRSPLQEAGLYKEEIRELSKDMNLSNLGTSHPCLSCFQIWPYGETITEEKLHMVDQAEQFLMDLGFHQFRTYPRYHGKDRGSGRRDPENCR